MQRWILQNYLNKISVSNRANGFVLKRGIKRNAMFHLNKRYILTMDIKDFFPSISQNQVFNSLNKHFEDKELAIKISKLCTFKRRLPQGAPTSPMLSNIVFLPIDEQITKHCNTTLVNYSRYADDLTFSSDNKKVLVFIYNYVSKLLYENGFDVNKKKTRYLSGKGVMSITGVNVNTGKVKISKKRKQDVRALLYNYIIKEDKSISKNVIAGHISYIRSIEPDYLQSITEYIKKLRNKVIIGANT
ncbi:MAG: RNA-directed DNA polymerase [Saprospiraceae bacterium]|nr:RNA-directed DNA polymerase [Saprospiraceae bacterium]